MCWVASGRQTGAWEETQPGTCSYLTWVLYVWAHKGEPRALDTCKVLERMALGWAPRQSSDEAGEPSLHQCLGGQAQWVSLLSISYLFTSKPRWNLPIWGKPPLDHSNQGPMSSTTDQEAHVISPLTEPTNLPERYYYRYYHRHELCNSSEKEKDARRGESWREKKNQTQPKKLIKAFLFPLLSKENA